MPILQRLATLDKSTRPSLDALRSHFQFSTDYKTMDHTDTKAALVPLITKNSKTTMSHLSVADAAVLTAPSPSSHTTLHRTAPSWFPGLLSKCLTYLDSVALLQCDLVALEWHAVVRDPMLWALLYCTTWRNGTPIPATLLAATPRDQFKRIYRDRSTLKLTLSTRARWWVHNKLTLRVHNISLQRKFSRGCVESMRTNHALPRLGLSPPSAAVYYYEVTIRGGGSVGIVNLSEVNLVRYYGAGSSSHLGWWPGSFGYHGDDGKIYWHDGTAQVGGYATPYGPSWGDTQSAIPSVDRHRVTTIGCGMEAATCSLFFTLNGKFLNRASMRVVPSRDGFAAAVSLHHLGDTAELNLGRAAFQFDIERYIAEMMHQEAAAADGA